MARGPGGGLDRGFGGAKRGIGAEEFLEAGLRAPDDFGVRCLPVVGLVFGAQAGEHLAEGVGAELGAQVRIVEAGEVGGAPRRRLPLGRPPVALSASIADKLEEKQKCQAARVRALDRIAHAVAEQKRCAESIVAAHRAAHEVHEKYKEHFRIPDFPTFSGAWEHLKGIRSADSTKERAIDPGPGAVFAEAQKKPSTGAVASSKG